MFGARAQGTGYFPPLMSPGFASSFTSLREAPGTLRTWTRRWCIVEDQPLRPRLTSMACSPQRSKGGGRRPGDMRGGEYAVGVSPPDW